MLHIFDMASADKFILNQRNITADDKSEVSRRVYVFYPFCFFNKLHYD